MAESRWLTVEEVAELLHGHIRTVQRYVREGKLPASKVGKRYWIAASAVDDLMLKNVREPREPRPSRPRPTPPGKAVSTGQSGAKTVPPGKRRPASSGPTTKKRLI
jgi:excisionase family DNA binding protein